MRPFSRILFALSVLAFAAMSSCSGIGTAIAQTSQQWVKVANEGDTVKATATVRYGVTNCVPSSTSVCWVQLAVTGQFVASNAFFKVDPDLGVAKELDVLQTSVAQTVTVNGKPVIVPALPTPVVTPSLKTCSVPAQTIPVTINSDGSFTANLSGLVVTCK